MLGHHDVESLVLVTVEKTVTDYGVSKTFWRLKWIP
jgi:hypothetical protein